MKIGLLECDHISEKYRHLGADYSSWFIALFPEFEFQLYDVYHGIFPEDINECDAYMCTGSRHSVYENIDWINRLKAFVQKLYKEDKPFVGVCFGHQMIGEALGGKVWKTPAGWSVGVHTFEITQQEAWMVPFQKEINLLMMCQDQIMELPENALVLAKTNHYPVGIFTVGNYILGVQAHPEFPKSYNQALMEDRYLRIGEEKVKTGIESLTLPTHPNIIALWIVNFLNRL